MALAKTRYRVPAQGELAVVVGAGRSGLAAAKLLRRKGANVRLLEANVNALSEEQQKATADAGIELILGPHSSEQFKDASFIVPSPGIPLSALSEWLKDSSAEVLSEMELAWRCLDDEPVLAVTGSSGKTTTASLAAAMLKAQGYAVFLGGNIGTPLSEYIMDGRKADVIVLEASSFQLQGCKTFCPRVAVLLNISPNHLDHHRDMQEYADAKFRIFSCQDENDLAILGRETAELASGFNIKARKVWLTDENRFPETKLLGDHNRINIEAAWQAARFFGVSLANAASAVARFAPLPHRLEVVASKNGVTFINDSKATTPAALEVALKAVNAPVLLLCGGKFKGGDLQFLRDLIRRKVRKVYLFGASREEFEKAWNGVVPISWHPTMRDAMQELARETKSGDTVLLSPATASFDLYANYMARGDDFKRLVEIM